ncbi:DUF397 domain-containing protein [Streptomyces sp. P1-3]|uniref:DUF397 domain-containing protein n=1 Tax=Streptomyces sp. P1-3 TaxID=3421658 RepID=UPI003D35D5FA
MSELAELYAADLTGAGWLKSSYTSGDRACVEVADIPGLPAIAVRDSKNTDIPAARVSRTAWSAFLAAVADGALTPAAR